MIRLQTVDVWDTLLRRRCHPDAVKLHVAGCLLARCWADIGPSLRSPRRLLSLRLETEKELASLAIRDPDKDDEYRLADVLYHWLKKVLRQSQVSDELVASLTIEEIEQEQRVSYADPGILARLSRLPNVPTYFLSDFYMPASVLGSLLDAKGLGDRVRGGYCSCELGLNKRSGRLFRAVQELHGIEAAEHFHLGDRRDADYVIPRRIGMQAERYRNRREERLATYQARAFRNRGGLFRDLTRTALASLDMPVTSGARSAFRFGIRCAPLFIGFALHLLEEASRQRHSAVYFLSREGAFFVQIYDALRGAGVSPGALAPDSAHLDISRRSSFAASLRSVSIEEMQRLWRGYAPMSMRTWAMSLGIDPECMVPICHAHGLDIDEALRAPAADPRALRLMADPEWRGMVNAHSDAQATLLKDYLAQRGLSASTSRVALVDIGWRGTIQDNIALLLPSVKFSGYYLGLQRFLNPQPDNGTKSAYGPDLNRDSTGAELFGQLPLMEMLCTPAQAGVVGYRRKTDGRVIPRRTEDEHVGNSTWNRSVAPFQEAVMRVLPMWAEAIRVHAIDSTELHGLAMERWDKILRRAPKVLRRARSELAHDERFGRGMHRPPNSKNRLRFKRSA